MCWVANGMHIFNFNLGVSNVVPFSFETSTLVKNLLQIKMAFPFHASIRTTAKTIGIDGTIR